eukprot:TRINITY_DN3022_c0_g1_i8.p1 TRINITY_DN3022_c0_g1~~TRINITY_DN3022_c0_g1_i8.p1  ORF type:complete len:313 (+),score=-17.99 TRINITY_DN3022_c0_g1_i8:95-940(+)
MWLQEYKNEFMLQLCLKSIQTQLQQGNKTKYNNKSSCNKLNKILCKIMIIPLNHYKFTVDYIYTDFYNTIIRYNLTKFFIVNKLQKINSDASYTNYLFLTLINWKQKLMFVKIKNYRFKMRAYLAHKIIQKRSKTVKQYFTVLRTIQILSVQVQSQYKHKFFRRFYKIHNFLFENQEGFVVILYSIANLSENGGIFQYLNFQPKPNICKNKINQKFSQITQPDFEANKHTDQILVPSNLKFLILFFTQFSTRQKQGAFIQNQTTYFLLLYYHTLVQIPKLQ